MSEFVVARFVANDVVDVSRALKEYEELRKLYDEQSSNDKLSNYNGILEKMIKMDNILKIMAGDMREDNSFRLIILARPERRVPATYRKATYRVIDEGRAKLEEKETKEKDIGERPTKRAKIEVKKSRDGTLVALFDRNADRGTDFCGSHYRKFMEEYVTNHIIIQCEIDEKLNDKFLQEYAKEIKSYKSGSGTIFRLCLESFRDILCMYQKLIGDLPISLDKKELDKLESRYEKAVDGKKWCCISSNDESDISKQYIFHVKYLDKEYKVELPQRFPCPLYRLSQMWTESKLMFKIEKSDQVTYK